MTGIWPAKTKCAVMLTFDMDGPSGMLQRDRSLEGRPTPMSMGDFGPEVGTPRILSLLADYNVASTFFIPGWIAERHPGAVEAVVRAGHEVGHHGYLHEPPASFGSVAQEAEALDRGSAALEKATGKKPAGYRSPSWDITGNTLKLLAARRFLYDSSLMGDDAPYFVDIASGRRTGRGYEEEGIGGFASHFNRMVEIPVHWSLDDAPYFAYNPAIGRTGPLLSPQVLYDTWLWEFEMAYSHGGGAVLTMHPYVSGHWSRLNALERFLRHVFATPGADFFKCEDIARHWTEQASSDSGERPGTR